MTTVALGFLPKPLMLTVDSLLPSVSLDPKLLSSHKFRQIRESIAEIGLIEPLAVTSVGRKSGQHMVLDGHLRLQAVKEWPAWCPSMTKPSRTTTTSAACRPSRST